MMMAVTTICKVGVLVTMVTVHSGYQQIHVAFGSLLCKACFEFISNTSYFSSYNRMQYIIIVLQV